MKKVIFAFAALLVAFSGQAQIKKGTVVYEEVINLAKKLGPQMEQFKGMLPEERKSYKELSFNEEAAICLTKEAADLEINQTDANGNEMQIQMKRPDETFYTDLKKKQLIANREFMTRKFLVTSNFDELDWKITGEQKTILDIPCVSATATRGENTVVVYFAPTIPVSAGPNSFVGLPGMVLYANLNDGEYTVTAIQINEDKVDESIITKPTEGKKMNKKDFDALMEEKMEEMREQNGGQGGNGVMIRVERD